jgi:twitching motility protein PilT
MFEPYEQKLLLVQLAESLVAALAQSLVRTTDSKRAAIHEILLNTDTIKDFIRRGEVEETEAPMKEGSFSGMCTMNQSIYNLYKSGKITKKTVLEASPKRNELESLIRSSGNL